MASSLQDSNGSRLNLEKQDYFNFCSYMHLSTHMHKKLTASFEAYKKTNLQRF